MSKKTDLFVYFFQFRFEFGCFFWGPMFFSDLKGDVCFFLPFLGVISPSGKDRLNNEKKKGIKHSQHIILIDLSNKYLHFTHETHPC